MNQLIQLIEKETIIRILILIFKVILIISSITRGKYIQIKINKYITLIQ